MPWRPHGRAEISSRNPEALGLCDKCGFLYNLDTLRWQYDFAGADIQNKRTLVCRKCYDEPQSQLKAIILPPDPLPIFNPRVESYIVADAPDYLIIVRLTEDGKTRTTQLGDLRTTENSVA